MLERVWMHTGVDGKEHSILMLQRHTFVDGKHTQAIVDGKHMHTIVDGKRTHTFVDGQVR